MMYIECDVFHFHGIYLNGIYGNKINKWMNENCLKTFISKIAKCISLNYGMDILL